MISFLLPQGLDDYYDLVDIEEKDDQCIFYLDEKNKKPFYLDPSVKITSKGFFEPRSIRDFNWRGKPTFLKVRRRKWLREDTGTIIHNDWKMAQEGTRMTVELADFLKELDRQYAN